MKKIIFLILALVMIFTFVSCGDKDNEVKDPDDTDCTSHVDSDNDKKCDNCNADIKSSSQNGTDTPIIPAPGWQPQ